jgi:hypothetical protein
MSSKNSSKKIKLSKQEDIGRVPCHTTPVEDVGKKYQTENEFDLSWINFRTMKKDKLDNLLKSLKDKNGSQFRDCSPSISKRPDDDKKKIGKDLIINSLLNPYIHISFLTAHILPEVVLQPEQRFNT